MFIFSLFFQPVLFLKVVSHRSHRIGSCFCLLSNLCHVIGILRWFTCNYWYLIKLPFFVFCVFPLFLMYLIFPFLPMDNLNIFLVFYFDLFVMFLSVLPYVVCFMVALGIFLCLCVTYHSLLILIYLKFINSTIKTILSI